MIGDKNMINWSSDFATGVNIIDEQHKELFRIGNELSLMVVKTRNQDSSEQIKEKITELMAYTRYHFSTEEKLFIIYNYKFSEEHKLQHQDFIEYMNSFEFSNNVNEQLLNIKRLVNYIAKWIFTHIHDSDMKFVTTLSDKNIKELSN